MTRIWHDAMGSDRLLKQVFCRYRRATSPPERYQDTCFRGATLNSNDSFISSISFACGDPAFSVA